MRITWMKVTHQGGYVFWVAIEGDAIVARRDDEVGTVTLEHPLRADDNLSEWGRRGCTIEGPFDEPE